MTGQNNLERFNEIYENTYQSVLKYVVCKCANLSDVNDIVQEVYIEVYKKISELTIKEIAGTLRVGESYVKNCLYRTLKELQRFMEKESDIND